MTGVISRLSIGFVVVGGVDTRSNKYLLPPTPGDLENLAQRSRMAHSVTIPVECPQSPVRSLRRRLSPQEIEKVVTRYKAGQPITLLSQEYGISRPGLREILRDEGVAFRRRGMAPEEANRAVRLYESGLTIVQVVARVGYSYSVVCRMLHKRGVAVRPRRHQETRKTHGD